VTTTHCVEVATFTLKPGVSDGQLLELETRIRRDVIASRPGYLGRELCKDDGGGEWLIVMRFDSRAHMDAWLAEVRSVPEMRELGAMIESFGMNRLFTHWS
jgi:antibiotic biosynthesis monooxygenase (ABM) superfamily enzyme